MNGIIDKLRVVPIQGIKYPVGVRPDTSDVFLIKNIFEFKAYDIELSYEPKFIIDAGANVGYSAVFFANKYPGVHIVGIEPETSNFRLLQYNTSFYKNIQLLKSGVWNSDCTLKVMDIGLGKWGFIVVPCDPEEEGAFKACSIKSILAASGFEEIDILKMDVEGAENEIFSSGFEQWLPRVKVLMIEVHDRMRRGCSKSLFKAISQYDFTLTVRGENLIFIREDVFWQSSTEN